MTQPPLNPQTLLSAYSQGAFPMADRDGVISWFTADPRGVIPLDKFHVPGTLKQLVRNPKKFEVRINCDFAATMRACCETRPDGSLINEKLIAAYVRLHELGFDTIDVASIDALHQRAWKAVLHAEQYADSFHVHASFG